MIPHRMLNEISGNGLRERVTACRKRLRVNRGSQRTPALNEICELFADTQPETITAHDDFNVNEVVLAMKEPEVGIT